MERASDAMMRSAEIFLVVFYFPSYILKSHLQSHIRFGELEKRVFNDGWVG